MEDSFETAKLFLLVMKFFGLFPASIDGTAERRKVKLIFSFLPSVVTFMTLIVLIYENFAHFEIVETSSIILQIAYNSILLVGLILLGFITIYQWTKAKDISKYLKSINCIDLRVSVETWVESFAYHLLQKVEIFS